MQVSSESDTGHEAIRSPGRDQKVMEKLVRIKGKFRYDNPHLWVISGLFAILTLLYYAEQLLADMPIQVGFFQTVHDLHRALFLVPLIYAAIAYRLRGSLVGSAFFLAVILPRALIYSTLPDPVLRPLVFFFLALALSILVAVQMNYIEYRLKTTGDLLKLREETAMLSAAKDELGRFFSMVAHDMKSPLAAVQNYLNTMLAGYSGDLNVKQRNWLERSNIRLEELTELITDLVDISRVRNGIIINEIKNFSLKDEIKRCVSDAQPIATQKEINLVTDIKGSLPEIFGSDTQIRRVITNLIGNAIKYTPEKGEITVRALNQGDSVLVEVIDNGIGIPENDLPKIFNDFYRASNTESIKGTGLGLSIASAILEIHGGKISMESPVSGTEKGCKCSFVLPVKI